VINHEDLSKILDTVQNDRCAPFTWTKDPDTVIAKATDPRHRKTQTTSDTEH
jgi:hypothetical protein